MTTLRELIAHVDDLDDGAVIYASRPWSPQASAVVGAGDEHPDGHDYLLEVDLVREVLTVWSAWREDRLPTLDEAALAVIHYANHDSYEPVDEAR